jgi:hypothetical protein
MEVCPIPEWPPELIPAIAATAGLALFFLVGFNPALGEVRIEGSTGGEVSHYLELFAVLRRSGERIVIDGPCYSACTLVLSTIPHNRVCVTRPRSWVFMRRGWSTTTVENISLPKRLARWSPPIPPRFATGSAGTAV